MKLDPAGWPGGFLVLLLALAGTGIAGAAAAEEAPLLRSRAFQSCFAFTFQGLQVEMALEAVAATATAVHLVGVASLVQNPPSRPTVAVTGVARQRVSDPHLDFGLSFQPLLGRFRLTGRLLAPGYAGGSATIYRFTDPFPVAADVPLTPIPCPTEFGDF